MVKRASAFACSRECQIAAWKGGHKKACKQREAARASAGAAPIPQREYRSIQTHMQLMDRERYREVIARQDEMQEVIETLQRLAKMPAALGLIIDLGIAHRNLGQVSSTRVWLAGDGA